MVTKLFFYLLIPFSLTELLNDGEENVKYGDVISPQFIFLNKLKYKERFLSDAENEKDSSIINNNFGANDYDDYAEKLAIAMPNNTLESDKTGEEQGENKTKNYSADLKSIKNWGTKGSEFTLHFPEVVKMKIKKIKLDQNNELTISVGAKEKTVQHLDNLQGEETIIMPPANNGDVIVFKFADAVGRKWKDITTIKQDTSTEETHDFYVNDEILAENIPHKLNQTTTENICTYLKKTKCHEKNGTIYTPKSSKAIKFTNAFFVCCILSLPLEDRLKVVRSPENRSLKRVRRSTKEVSKLNQREFLLRNKFRAQTSQQNAQLTKIVTPDDDFLDPYWNIKNSNLKGANKQGFLKQEHYEDYVEDYIVELPKPGLVGIYSDGGNKQPSWTNEYENPNPSYGGNDDYSEETLGGSFGYSTIDPRRVTSSKSQRRRPVKITTEPPEEESAFDIESQTVNFQSNPNFQVLHGFKILNLGRTKSKYHNRNTKRSTTESSVENDDERGDEDQIFGQCGKTSNNKGKSETREISDTEIGSHPWLALVVPSRRPQNVLCYATIIHPRASITAGDCVSEYSKRTAGKDVLVLVAGLREVEDRSDTQSRTVTIQMHPQWRRENLAHNLALLHWNRPLQLSTSIQPVCLSRSYDHDDCKFYGWGGFDQAIRPRARWQRATVVPSHECDANFTKKTKLPADAFCATVKERGTVTGIGGSLTCNVDGRATSVGVAVYRDKAIVLLPAHEWIQRAMDDLKIE